MTLVTRRSSSIKWHRKRVNQRTLPSRSHAAFPPLNYLGQLPNGLPVSFISPSDVDMTEFAGRLLTAPFHYLCGCSFSLGFVLFFFFLLREQRWVPSHLMGYLLGPPLTLHFSSDLFCFLWIPQSVPLLKLSGKPDWYNAWLIGLVLCWGDKWGQECGEICIRVKMLNHIFAHLKHRCKERRKWMPLLSCCQQFTLPREGTVSAKTNHL